MSRWIGLVSVSVSVFAVVSCRSSESTGPAVVASGLTAHEWGTFTSMVDSTGHELIGLHHEEEPLPDFVYRRSREAVRRWKGAEARPVHVNQKLETPVVYFYADREMTIDLRVDFPKGVISEWFPAAQSYLPALDPNLTSLAAKDGSMAWRARVAPTLSAAAFPPVAATDIWAPSRNVAATPLSITGENGDEQERFIFYRGIGDFTLPFQIHENADGTLDIVNDSNDASPAVFLLRVHEGGGAIVPLGSLSAHGSIRSIPAPAEGKERNLDEYVADAKQQIAASLVGSGLYADEAQAMVDTWSKSYFQSFGLRVLYVVPRQWTDALLPMTMTPVPDALVRTLVGRVEVLTRADEANLMTRITQAKNAQLPYATLLPSLGRFAEPKLRRAAEMTSDATLKTYVEGAIEAANAVDTAEP